MSDFAHIRREHKMTRIDELALSLSLLSDEDMARLALTLWMRYPRTCRSITDEFFLQHGLMCYILEA